MTPEQFVFWLKGYFEAIYGDKFNELHYTHEIIKIKHKYEEVIDSLNSRFKPFVFSSNCS